MKPKAYRSFAESLHRHRPALGLFTYRFANGCGCSEATIRHFENGRSHPSLETCFRIADFLKLPRGRVARLAGCAFASAAELPTPMPQRLKHAFQNAIQADPDFWTELIETANQLGPKGKESLVIFARFVLSQAD
ncbi:MAG TPA: helix-turn-helix transcriptional regulator [Anaerolineae bacterium]|nr:helix-turn-helix transcriptional regulator [Anaerolineae bacterium]